MKKILLATVAVFALAGIAQAADLPARRTNVVAYAPVAGVWTGFYAGLHAGWSHGEFKTTDLTTPFGKSTSRSNSLSGGAYAGYNYQINQIVVGAEADFTLFNLGDTKILYNAATTCTAACYSTNLTTDSKWLATVRGRVGYAMDRFLPFITAGVAFTESKQSYLVNTTVTTESKNRVGYALGAGVDYAFTNNIIGRLEYQYAKFDGDKFNVVTDKSDLTFHTARAGVAYKF